MRKFGAIGAFIILSGAAFGQSEAKPSFEIADIHLSGPSLTPGMRGPLRQGVRWGLKNGTMVDLIGFAYGVEPEKVLGGPGWLEFDRFDVIGKAAFDTPPEKLKEMLQSLLADRFKLVLHSDTRPFPGFILTAGKNAKFKESDGSGQAGCGLRMMAAPGADAGGLPAARTLAGSCHNATMGVFANFIRGWISPAASQSGVKIVDKTGLTERYDFELKFSTADSPAVIMDAVDKQLGLKLEPLQIPETVILVDSANRKPTPNAPEVATAFPPAPSEFDVASLKPSAPVPAGGRGGSGGGMYQNDRLTRLNATLTQLINTAWNVYSADQIVGLPKFADTDRYDLMAKVPLSIATTEGGTRDQVDLDLYRAMYRKLLTDRFQMKVHFEDRPLNAWVLTAQKPKLQKADPSSRTKFTDGPAAGEKDPRKGNAGLSRLVSCHNMAMAEFAALLPSIAPGYQLGSVRDETGLSGSWDFSLSFSGVDPSRMAGIRGGGDAQPGTASDPSGGISLADAIVRQLGLKLELQKRPTQVLVIDHIEPKPTEN